ncbi:MAG: Hsp20/alpha crystallin family protein [Chloroflexi bacterium]|nr:Hsp20/alpha crystallin family protein [Chloroflexota bacterium]
MALTRWDPFREMVSLRDAMNRLFDESWLRPWWRLGEGETPSVFVPLDMVETDGDIVISAPLPGLKPEDVDISITGNTVTIKGEFREEQEGKRENVHFRERRYGAFQRAVTLPTEVDANKAEATFENGVLKLTIPKTEEAKPKKIQIKTK